MSIGVVIFIGFSWGRVGISCPSYRQTFRGLEKKIQAIASGGEFSSVSTNNRQRWSYCAIGFSPGFPRIPGSWPVFESLRVSPSPSASQRVPVESGFRDLFAQSDGAIRIENRQIPSLTAEPGPVHDPFASFLPIDRLRQEELGSYPCE